MANFSLCSIVMNKNDEHKEYKAKCNNKLTHALNRNSTYKHIKIIQINMGNGIWCSIQDLLKVSVENHSPDIKVISKSNVNILHNKMIRSRRSLFGQFLLFDKIFKYSTNAQLTVLINSTFEVERKVNLENNINSTMVFTINTSARKKHTLIANYKQCKGTASKYEYNERTVVGDLNLDRHEPNDPEARPDVKTIIPLLKDFQARHIISLQNRKPRCYRVGQRPSLLDLILTSHHQNISNIGNITNFLIRTHVSDMFHQD